MNPDDLPQAGLIPQPKWKWPLIGILLREYGFTVQQVLDNWETFKQNRGLYLKDDEPDDEPTPADLDREAEERAKTADERCRETWVKWDEARKKARA